MGKPELVEEAGHRGIGLRVMKGKQVASTSTSDLSDAGIDRAVKDAIELAELAQEDPFAGPADPKLLTDPSKAPDLELYDPAGGTLDAASAIKIATAGEAAALGFDPRITNSDGATFGRTAGGVALVLSSGFRAVYRGSYQSLSVVPVAEDDGGKKRRGYHWTAKRHLAELDPADEVGREAARRTLRKLGARTVPTCEVPVVFDPDAARSILGLLAGCAMGSSIWRKSSYLIGRENTPVASDLVTITDDPLLPRAPGSRRSTARASRAARTCSSRRRPQDVPLRQLLRAQAVAREHGQRLARRLGRRRREHVEPDPLTGRRHAGGHHQGHQARLYVTEMMGFGFNAVTGDFSRGASGLWIENGELTFPVSEVTISLNVDELWKRVDAVGNDLDLRTSTASPTFRVSKMTIAGGVAAEGT